MLSRKITDGTEFVVFDMEWNQPMPGKEYPFDVSKLTGEIIEIGAFKYVYDNGELIYKDPFSTDIIPVKYTKLHYHVKKVTHKKNADLLNGIPFRDAYSQFREFCGDAILVGWGSSDPSMLKMNLEFFEMDSKLNMFFLDLQPIFSLFAGLQGTQRSVEAAVDFYNIDNVGRFKCTHCDFKSEEKPNYLMESIDFKRGKIVVNGEKYGIKLLKSFFLYDYLLAVSVLREWGITPFEIQHSFDLFKLEGGRAEDLEVGNKILKYVRIKQENPETLQSAYNDVAEDNRSKIVMIGLLKIEDIIPNYSNTFYTRFFHQAKPFVHFLH